MLFLTSLHLPVVAAKSFLDVLDLCLLLLILNFEYLLSFLLELLLLQAHVLQP